MPDKDDDKKKEDGTKPWLRVIYAVTCDDKGNCTKCGIDYADCTCEAPPLALGYEYEWRDNGLFARRLDGEPEAS